jgi:hypothetical protein
MRTGKSFFLMQCIAICGLLSPVIGAIHYCLLTAWPVKVPLCVAYGEKGIFHSLVNIWRTQMVRRIISVLVRSPLRLSTLRLVNSTVSLPPGSGCVIAICHTPWKRLLVQWCLENNAVFIISNGKWTHQKERIQKRCDSLNDLCDIVTYLRQNGRVVIAFDNFNNHSNYCRLKFLGHHYNVSMLPVRLAKIAGVPLVSAIPRFRNGMINIDHGPQFSLNKVSSDPEGVMRTLVSFLETGIKSDPGIWPAAYYQIIGSQNRVFNLIANPDPAGEMLRDLKTNAY